MVSTKQGKYEENRNHEYMDHPSHNIYLKYGKSREEKKKKKKTQPTWFITYKNIFFNYDINTKYPSSKWLFSLCTLNTHNMKSPLNTIYYLLKPWGFNPLTIWYIKYESSPY